MGSRDPLLRVRSLDVGHATTNTWKELVAGLKSWVATMGSVLHRQDRLYLLERLLAVRSVGLTRAMTSSSGRCLWADLVFEMAFPALSTVLHPCRCTVIQAAIDTAHHISHEGDCVSLLHRVAARLEDAPLEHAYKHGVRRHTRSSVRSIDAPCSHHIHLHCCCPRIDHSHMAYQMLGHGGCKARLEGYALGSGFVRRWLEVGVW